jgi:hypothetical protein
MTRKLLTIFTVLFFSVINTPALFAQATVTSSTGYTVQISLQTVSIVPSGNSCANGYNYNVMMHYVISFSGTNIPDSLYTLQGKIGCGDQTHHYDLPNVGGSGNVTSQSNPFNPNSDCATATPESLMCNIAGIEIEGPGIPLQNVFVPLSAGVLPIQLLSFNTEAQKDKVKISWATVSENNNDFFTIERSTDAATWSIVKTIKGAGNSSTLKNYSSFDEKPVVGTSYYRLKQTDLNGKFNYSDVKLVKYTSGDNIFAFPVPNTGNTVNFKGIIQPKNIELTIYNISGAKVFTTTLQTNAVELPVLKAAVYVMTLTNKVSGDVTNIRYVKL